MSEAYLDRSVRALLEAFGAPHPTPGGGSAAALAGAIGAALCLKVATLPRTRSGSDAERATLALLQPELIRLRDVLLRLVDEDARAYLAVVAASRLPRGTPEAQARRAAEVQAALERAAAVPLETMRAAADLLAVAERVVLCGSPRAASDVAVAVDLLAAAVRGAHANVTANLDDLADRGRAARLRAEADRLAARAASAVRAAHRALASSP